jgi:RNA polymerase sigma-70 factor (ECF subfamily)
MPSTTSIIGIDPTTDRNILDAARHGDREAFDELIAPLQDQLLAHCYRMLGSIHDADDALQDTLVRGWKGLAGFAGRSEFSTWLYRIATNASLDAISRNARRVLPVDLTLDDVAGAESMRWIEPFAHAVGPESPEAAVVRRESVELAFVTALQILPANQRAVLLLRDVLAFSAADTATVLGTSVASVTSSLQRARRTIEQRVPEATQRAVIESLGASATDGIATRYVEAWERSDTQAIVDLLCADATFSMPPHPTWFAGPAAIGQFLADEPLRHPWRLFRTEVGGHLAFACYTIDAETGDWTAHSLDVLTLGTDGIEAIVGFLDASLVTRLGFPERYEPSDITRD